MLEFSYPEQQQLYDYWDSKRGGRFAPSRGDIDPIDFPHLLPNLCIYKIHRNPLRYEVTLMGTRVVEIWGVDYTGKFVEDVLLGPVYDQVTEQFRHIVNNKEPTLHDLDANWLDKDYIKYSRLMLPLSENGINVDRLLLSVVLQTKGSS